MLKGRTTLIALAAAMLIPGAVQHARADLDDPRVKQMREELYPKEGLVKA